MAKFTDADARTWTLEVSTVEIKRVRAELGVDLLDVGSKELWSRLTRDDELLVDILHVCCREQCEARDVDAVSFARGLRGETLDEAAEAFLEEYVAFFRRHRRAVLTAAMQRTEEFLKKTAAHALQTINSQAMDRLLEAELQAVDLGIEEELSRISGGSSPNTPPSPASDLASG